MAPHGRAFVCPLTPFPLPFRAFLGSSSPPPAQLRLEGIPQHRVLLSYAGRTVDARLTLQGQGIPPEPTLDLTILPAVDTMGMAV